MHVNNLLRIFLLLIALSYTFEVAGQQTYEDNFNVESYANNDGNSNFATNWVETNDNNSATNGNIEVRNDVLEFDEIDNGYITRTLNLNGASSVVLTLDYDRSDNGNEGLEVQLWNATTSSWQVIETINDALSPATGTITHNLTTAQISSTSRIRFRGEDSSWGNNEVIYVDDVLFTATFGPSVSVADMAVSENAGSAVFTITHMGPNTIGPFIVNYSITAGTAAQGTDYTTTSGLYTGSLTFNGTSGDTEQITVLITDDAMVESDENYSIQFTSVTNGSVDITDTATGTINDNDSFIITDGVTDTTCSGVFLDNGGFGNYSNNQDREYTLCPDNASSDLNINFTVFDLESGFDFLYIYEGTSTAGTLIGQFHNGNPPPTNITSTDASGCLTFRFTSDGSVTEPGWEATISCITRGPRLAITDVTVNEGDGNVIFDVTHVGANTIGPFTVNYQTVDGTAVAGSDYTAIASGTLIFNGTIGDTNQITVAITDDAVYESSETFDIQFTGVTDPVVDFSDIGTATIDDNEPILINTPLALFEEFDGYIGYTSTGGTLRTQSNGVDACAVDMINPSTGQLTSDVPVGGTIDKAYLYWAHSGALPDAQVTFEGSTVNADLVYSTSLSGGRIFYGGISDVTTIVQGVANPNSNVFDFTDLSVDTSSTYCGSATVLGGWSLIVFYTDLNLPASTINLYQGFHGESSSSSTYTLDGFFAIGAAGSKTTALSWEGDQTLSNSEALTVTTGLGTFPLVGDGDNTLLNANPFNSTHYDNSDGSTYNDATTYGVDLDTYDVSPYIQPGESTVTTNIQSGQDFVILNAVVLKVPSNLVTGIVFEDVNYGGGAGRNVINASGIPLPGVDLELYDGGGTLFQSATTDVNGRYVFAGMANGTYSVRVVNGSVRSSRGGGTACTTCIPAQTFRKNYLLSTLTEITDEVGGANPSVEDPAANTLTGAQTISSVTILNEGVAGLDFGFNFNTIVNTNEDGQGSLEQFIVNSNNLDETGLDIEANVIFNPAAGEDTSIFMIPPTSDALGRTADANYNAGGYFEISLMANTTFTDITGLRTNIDGRTQTAYSGNSNAGTVGAGGTTVGVGAIILPNYDLPEIQVFRENGDVLTSQGTNFVIRNTAVYANNSSGIIISGGSATLSNNLIGVGADGITNAQITHGVEVIGGSIVVDGNYLTLNNEAAIWVNGGASTLIQNNHITSNGASACDDNIILESGSGISIQQNLIENAASLGIDGDGISGNVIISENTITNSGQNGGACGGNIENAGVLLDGSDSFISNNIIANNGGPGLVLAGGTGSGNLISQNSFYANGTDSPALGIDLDLSDNVGDGVTLNDNGDPDSGPNGALNFPIISDTFISGSTLRVMGWARPGSIIEFFFTDINEGTAATGDNQLGLSTDYGEGQVYIGTATEGSGSDSDSSSSMYTDIDGNADSTNKFQFNISLPPGTTAGEWITATATIANSTSEFSPLSIIKIPTVITNRRITYRVKKN